MKWPYHLLAVAGCLLMASCSGDDALVDDNTEIRINAEVVDAQQESTRAAGASVFGSFATTDQVYLYITDATSSTSLKTGAVTLSSSSVSTGIYYPTNGHLVNIKGYYPSSVTNTSTSFAVQADQSSETNYKSSDLMYAHKENCARQSGAHALTFNHALSKIIVQVQSDGTITTEKAVVTLKNVKRSATLSAGVFSAVSGSASTVTMGTTSSNLSTTAQSLSAIIVPQTIAASTQFIEVKLNTSNATYTYAIPSGGKTFASGNAYTYTLTLGLQGVSVTTSISSWTSQSTTTLRNYGSNTAVVPTDPSEYVDIGLFVGGASSGTPLLWAKKNVGAASETDYGLYFAWGDVTGYSGEVSSGTTAADGHSFSWDSYKWGTSSSSLTKYTVSDGKSMLEAADDAATAAWGTPWRMPTQAEMQALANTYNENDFGDSNTTKWKWEWKSNYNSSGHAGYLISYRASTANTTVTSTLFLPAAGRRYNASVNYQGSAGYYWLSVPTSDSPGYPSNAWYLYFGSGYAFMDIYFRFFGYTVRAVQSN